MKAALEAGKTTVEIVVDALGRMANDGKLNQQDYATARTLAKYKDDPNILAQLNVCGQRQGFNRLNPFNWLVTPAHANSVCMISTPEGTFSISVVGAQICRTAFASLTSASGLVGAAAGVILLATTVSAGGGKIDETHKLDDGTVVHLTGNGSDLRRTATLSMSDGTKSVLDFMLDPTTGALILTGGTLNGEPMASASLQNVIYSMHTGGLKNVVLSESAKGSGGSKAGASTGGAGAALGAPDPDEDNKRPNDPIKDKEKLERQMQQRGWTYDQVEEAIAKGAQHPAKNFKTGGSATRYVHPETGRSVIIDDITKGIIQVGGDGFKF